MPIPLVTAAVYIQEVVLYNVPSLSAVSVTCGQLPSENIKWKISEIIHKFQIACHSK